MPSDPSTITKHIPSQNVSQKVMIFLRQPQNIDLIAPTVYVLLLAKYIIGQTIARSQVKQISSAVNVPNVSVLACFFKIPWLSRRRIVTLDLFCCNLF